MEVATFFERVLSAQGPYFSFIIQGAKRLAIPSPTLEHLVAVQTAASAKPRADVYYALASFHSADDGRKQRNVRALKCLALDIDCGDGKPYTSWKYGVKALVEFVDTVALPRPLIVKSGNGIHAYWTFTEEVTAARRLQLATSLRRACEAHGLQSDHQVTTDNSRVLRAPGTVNQKNGAVVEVFLDAPAVPVEQMEATLSRFAAAAAAPAPTASPKPVSALAAALSAVPELPPAKPDVVERACAVIKWAVHNQHEVPEPLWYDMLGVAAYCEDAEVTAVRWSSQYPGHNEQETLKKLAQWKSRTTGPTTCDKLCITSGGELCAKCPHKSRVSTPVQLGVPVAGVPQTLTNSKLPDGAITNVPLPQPFVRTNGVIVARDKDGVETPLLNCDMYAISYGDDELDESGYVTLAFSTPLDGWKYVQFKSTMLAAGNAVEFSKLLANKNIFVRTKQQVEVLQLMLRDYIESLKLATRGSTMYGTMGWKRDNSEFVLGGTTYRKDDSGAVVAEDTAVAPSASRDATSMWETKGSVEKWVQATRVIDKANLKAHGFALCVGLSAPLYAFSGLKGSTISLYGPTGGGKSLAQLWMQSIYGDPDKLHSNAKFTQNALFSRMGLFNHLPVSVDEITNMEGDDIGEFLYWVTQGRDKARLSRNATERPAKTWATPVVVSTNRALTSQLSAGNMASEAQLARVMELYVAPAPLFTESTEVGRRLHRVFSENYGGVGAEFVQKLVAIGADKLKELVGKAAETFTKRFGAQFSGEERFWEQTLILAYLAGTMAKKWGLIDFEFDECILWALDELSVHRDVAKQASLDPYEVLSAYLTAVADRQLVAIHTNSSGDVFVDSDRVPVKGVLARFDLWRDHPKDEITTGSLSLDKGHLRHWLAAKGFDMKRVLDTFARAGVLIESNGRATLSKHTAMRQGQTRTVVLALTHERLRGMLNTDAGEPVAAPQHVRLVS